ncbi:histamine H1 receptor-like [Hyalella azteca]|uniref:Histamine H1 receptor-like n=1 Tax=Hyalella azteca TaxID=294128 RepID=A0A979FVE1_HYAAZ|nr:histamine H1 receptor-like [Hyalella azteca]
MMDSQVVNSSMYPRSILKENSVTTISKLISQHLLSSSLSTPFPPLYSIWQGNLEESGQNWVPRNSDLGFANSFVNDNQFLNPAPNKVDVGLSEDIENTSAIISSFLSPEINFFSTLNETLPFIGTIDAHSLSPRALEFNSSELFANATIETPPLLLSTENAASPQTGIIWQTIVLVILKLIVMGGIIVVAILGNILVIVSIFLNHRLHSLANHFLISLATADIMVAVCAMSFNASVQISGFWMFGSIICDLWNSFDVYFSTVSILHLCCISMDRYYAILKPLEYPIYMTRKVVFFMIAISWLLPTLISFLPIFLGWYATADHLQIRALDPYSCTFEVNSGYALLSSGLSFWTPCTVMLVMYFRIFQEARKQEAAIMSRTNSTCHMNNSRKKTPRRSRLRRFFSFGVSARARRGSSERQELSHLQLKHLPAIAEATRKSQCQLRDSLNQGRPSVTESIVSVTRCSVGSSPCLCSLSDKDTSAEYSNTLPKDKSRRVSLPLHDRSDVGTIPARDFSLRQEYNNALRKMTEGDEIKTESKNAEFQSIPEDHICTNSKKRVQTQDYFEPQSEKCPLSETDLNRTQDYDPTIEETELKLLGSADQDARVTVPDNSAVTWKRSSYSSAEERLTSPHASIKKLSQRSRGDSVVLEGRSAPHAPMMKREHKAARTLGIIMGAFIACWLPFFTWYVAVHICRESCPTPEPVVTLLFWIGYFNSTLNPFIYAYFRADFREAFRKTLRRFRCPGFRSASFSSY